MVIVEFMKKSVNIITFIITLRIPIGYYCCMNLFYTSMVNYNRGCLYRSIVLDNTVVKAFG